MAHTSLSPLFRLDRRHSAYSDLHDSKESQESATTSLPRRLALLECLSVCESGPVLDVKKGVGPSAGFLTESPSASIFFKICSSPHTHPIHHRLRSRPIDTPLILQDHASHTPRSEHVFDVLPPLSIHTLATCKSTLSKTIVSPTRHWTHSTVLESGDHRSPLRII